MPYTLTPCHVRRSIDVALRLPPLSATCVSSHLSDSRLCAVTYSCTVVVTYRTAVATAERRHTTVLTTVLVYSIVAKLRPGATSKHPTIIQHYMYITLTRKRKIHNAQRAADKSGRCAGESSETRLTSPTRARHAPCSPAPYCHATRQELARANSHEPWNFFSLRRTALLSCCCALDSTRV